MNCSPEPPDRPLDDVARASGALLDLWTRAVHGADADALAPATDRLVDFIRTHPADLEYTLLERLDELVQFPPAADDDDVAKPPLIVWLLGMGAPRPDADGPAARLREAMSAPALMAIITRLRRDHRAALHPCLHGLAPLAARLVRRHGERLLDELDGDATSPAWCTLVRAGARRDPSLLTPVLPCDEVHTWPEPRIAAALTRYLGAAHPHDTALELENPTLTLVHRDEPLASVVAHDAHLLHDLGVAPSELAARLRLALTRAERRAFGTKGEQVRLADVPWQCTIEALPASQSVADPLHDEDASFVHGLGRETFVLRHPEHGEVRGSDLAPLLIERACVFGATRAPLRVDPVRAARILGLHPADRHTLR